MEFPDVPFLGYVKRFGWIVFSHGPQTHDHGMMYYISRPGRLHIWSREIIAAAPVPPAPDAAR